MFNKIYQPVKFWSVAIFISGIIYSAAETYNSSLTAQTTEVGVGLYPGDSSYKSLPARELSDGEKKFAARAAEEFSIERKEIEKLLLGGFYKKEIARILVISRKTSTPLDRIVLMRKKRTTFADICHNLKVDYKTVIVESEKFFDGQYK